ncbi:MAG: hypothetical protein CO137_01665 [Candidatus Magasanikbacteria bacterium CG_4_9_14_3_um_filter_32_9]|uniref:Peptidase M50 domain-containing protein n=1 Tax=Candidatus Magasanikbacteria bacterium CG_4_9_14_3_um_filter_32_9 TaxID=1974644 RepID=A0A2M7Z6Y3_9BACT|nr:MAG: hypothetical protein CO137_01665 [Candidatus Magasanikbacteria bacterium CG_4_9_14_3_um_filter_32_9]
MGIIFASCGIAFLAIIIHEVGHFVSFRAKKIAVDEIIIGGGYEIAKRLSWGFLLRKSPEMKVSFCAPFPVFGFIPNGNIFKRSTTDQIVVYGAGIFANILSSLVVVWFTGFFFLVSSSSIESLVSIQLFWGQSLLIVSLIAVYNWKTTKISIFFLFFMWTLPVVIVVKSFFSKVGIMDTYFQLIETGMFGQSGLELSYGLKMCIVFVAASFAVAMLDSLPIPGFDGEKILGKLKQLSRSKIRSKFYF